MARRAELGYLRVYQWKTPLLSQASGVGVIFAVAGNCFITFPFPLWRCHDRRSMFYYFREAVSTILNYRMSARLTPQIIRFLACNFSFRHLQAVPPASPALVFIVGLTLDGMVAQLRTEVVLRRLRQRFWIEVNHSEDELVPVPAATAEIVRSCSGRCCCSEGFAPHEGVLRTTCNHVFHVSCFARSFSRHPSCPLCSTLLPRPVDVRTLLL